MSLLSTTVESDYLYDDLPGTPVVDRCQVKKIETIDSNG